MTDYQPRHLEPVGYFEVYETTPELEACNSARIKMHRHLPYWQQPEHAVEEGNDLAKKFMHWAPIQRGMAITLEDGPEEIDWIRAQNRGEDYIL